jgi:hypothetical protein
MIVTTQKPLDEIMEYIAPYKNILVVGCDGCTQPPRGLREANTLAQLLELGGKLRNKEFKFKTTTIAKQCDSHLVASILKPQLEGIDAILTMSCGIGVQELAELFPDIPVFPAQNTHFMGAEQRETGNIEERCQGCGECLLPMTGGICPVARCSKGLLTGACGGSKLGKCELDPAKDCAWVVIYNQLKKQGKLELLKKSRPIRDYRRSGWKAPA